MIDDRRWSLTCVLLEVNIKLWIYFHLVRCSYSFNSLTLSPNQKCFYTSHNWPYPRARILQAIATLLTMATPTFIRRVVAALAMARSFAELAPLSLPDFAPDAKDWFETAISGCLMGARTIRPIWGLSLEYWISRGLASWSGDIEPLVVRGTCRIYSTDEVTSAVGTDKFACQCTEEKHNFILFLNLFDSYSDLFFLLVVQNICKPQLPCSYKRATFRWNLVPMLYESE